MGKVTRGYNFDEILRIIKGVILQMCQTFYARPIAEYLKGIYLNNDC